jgi:hypothetical protein
MTNARPDETNRATDAIADGEPAVDPELIQDLDASDADAIRAGNCFAPRHQAHHPLHGRAAAAVIPTRVQ